MGGHSAWRKRVERRELAKGLGGAIMRHRPHRGRKGKDLIKNRKGHIGGGNPKKKKKKDNEETEAGDLHNQQSQWRVLVLVFFGVTMAYLLCYSWWPA